MDSDHSTPREALPSATDQLKAEIRNKWSTNKDEWIAALRRVYTDEIDADLEGVWKYFEKYIESNDLGEVFFHGTDLFLLERIKASGEMRSFPENPYGNPNHQSVYFVETPLAAAAHISTRGSFDTYGGQEAPVQNYTPRKPVIVTVRLSDLVKSGVLTEKQAELRKKWALSRFRDSIKSYDEDDKSTFWAASKNVNGLGMTAKPTDVIPSNILSYLNPVNGQIQEVPLQGQAAGQTI